MKVKQKVVNRIEFIINYKVHNKLQKLIIKSFKIN